MNYKTQFFYAFDDRMLTKLGTEPVGQTILVIRLVMYAIQLAAKNTVIFVTDDPEAKKLFDQTVRYNGEFGNDDNSYLIDPMEEINKNENKQAWIDWSKSLDMQFSVIIENPPFAVGNTINAELINHLTDNGQAVIIQPLSQYKGQKLYEHIRQFELADPKLFSGATITENLNISVVTKKKQNRFTWQQLVLESCDQNFRKFYDWNIATRKHYFMRQIRDEELAAAKIPANLDTWFFEALRCSAKAGGSGFGIDGFGYKWNVNKQVNFDAAYVGVINFNTKREKDNFQIWWYNGKKGESFSSRVILGTNNANFVGSSWFSLPQINWETIDQHPLWNITWMQRSWIRWVSSGMMTRRR